MEQLKIKINFLYRYLGTIAYSYEVLDVLKISKTLRIDHINSFVERHCVIKLHCITYLIMK